jgi:hypothetical protein
MSMAAPETLTDVYVDELRDLWSANEKLKALVEANGGETRDSSECSGKISFMPS